MDAPVTPAPPPSTANPSLAEKVEFLSRSSAYPSFDGPVTRRETHMSWVFFVGDRVYKLKKPVRFSYLDFSTPAQRRAACLAEFRLNRRLAPDVYLEVAELTAGADGLAINGAGEAVDWLVVMRRLDETKMLDDRLANHVQNRELDQLTAVLARFYRRTRRVRVAPAKHLADWRAALAENRRVLFDPCLGLPPGLVRRVDAAQRRFLRRSSGLLAKRAREGRILDAHGDLRPEHIWLGGQVKIIDCLEFSALLRANDPMDEIAFLDLECEQLGAPEAGWRLRHRLARALHDPAPEALYRFYRAYRATMRARLSIAHMLEPNPRTPEKWPAQARAYLASALRDSIRLERLLRTPEGP